MSSTSLKAVSLATQQISPYIVGWLDFGHLRIIQYSVQIVHERAKSKKVYLRTTKFVYILSCLF